MLRWDLDRARAASAGNASFLVPVRSESDADLVRVDVGIRRVHCLALIFLLGLAFTRKIVPGFYFLIRPSIFL